MTIDKIAHCNSCFKLDFCDKDGNCEWCTETSEILYSTGQIAASRPADANEPEAA